MLSPHDPVAYYSYGKDYWCQLPISITFMREKYCGSYLLQKYCSHIHVKKYSPWLWKRNLKYWKNWSLWRKKVRSKHRNGSYDKGWVIERFQISLFNHPLNLLKTLQPKMFMIASVISNMNFLYLNVHTKSFKIMIYFKFTKLSLLSLSLIII